jgi:hypothetical protein
MGSNYRGKFPFFPGQKAASAKIAQRFWEIEAGTRIAIHRSQRVENPG